MIDANKPKFRSFDSTSRSNLNPESRSAVAVRVSFSLHQCGSLPPRLLFFRFKVVEKKKKKAENETHEHIVCIFRENCTEAREKKKKKRKSMVTTNRVCVRIETKTLEDRASSLPTPI